MKRILGFSLLFMIAGILCSTGISIDSSRAADDSSITVAYSGNILGYTEPCG